MSLKMNRTKLLTRKSVEYCVRRFNYAAKVPKIKFNNGTEYPAFGLGTWKSKPGEVTQAVKDAIDIGYRHIDCAHVYENEKEVGVGLAAKMKEGAVERKDLRVTSKLWNTFHKPGAVEPALKVTLNNLGLKYVDLYLIHWPFGFKEGTVLKPLKDDNTPDLTDDDYVDTWKAMGEVYKKGLARAIGISNFNKSQIERLLQNSAIVPVTNQVECTPYLNQNKLIAFCKSKNITVTAYSPLGSGDRPNLKPDDPVLLKDAKFKEIGDRHKKTPAQVLLRYQIQRGLLTIPKSVKKSRLNENINIFNFALSQAEMTALNGMDRNGRTCGYEEAVHHKYHPFARDEY